MPFQGGKSGNPGGRPKDKPITDALRKKLAQEDWKGLNALINVWFARAMSGDMQAITQILDRLEGKPLQTTENHNVNENHYVRAPEKASKDDWGKYLDSKAKPAPAAAKPVNGANGNGKSH